VDGVVDITRELPGLPTLDGSLSWEDAVLDAAADDLGHLVRERPRAVLRPGSAGDVAAMVRWAGRQGWKVAARGQGHSVYGRSPGGAAGSTPCSTAHAAHARSTAASESTEVPSMSNSTASIPLPPAGVMGGWGEG
jgi:hypothetical protein